MPALDLSELFGRPQAPPDPRVSLALMLRYLSELLESSKAPEEEEDGLSQPPEPIPVRARVEPLGG